MAREHGATPVLVTAPARTQFTDDGRIKDGNGLHGGNNFAYIRAMRQIGEETHTVVPVSYTHLDVYKRQVVYSSREPYSIRTL